MNREDKRRQLYRDMREAAKDLEALERKRRRAYRRIMVFAGAIAMITLGLVVVVMHQDEGLQCAEMGYDEWQEEVCVQWENKNGVRTRRVE